MALKSVVAESSGVSLGSLRRPPVVVVSVPVDGLVAFWNFFTGAVSNTCYSGEFVYESHCTIIWYPFCNFPRYFRETGEPIFGITGSENEKDSTEQDCLCARNYHDGLKHGCKMTIDYLGEQFNEQYQVL